MRHPHTWFGSLFLALFACPSSAHAQQPPADATVVFFTPGGHWRGMGSKLSPFAGKAKTMSQGSVFDGDTFLATLTHSRYVVLHMDAGTHRLSASRTGDRANPKQSLTLDLKSGSVSYVAITTTVPSLVAGIAPLETSHINKATCEDFLADRDENHAEPLDPKLVGDASRSHLDDTFDVFHCHL